MSRLSFIAFCIEHYADHVGKPGNEIYALFRQTGLLDLLREDYDDLRGMGREYMVWFCGEYLKSEPDGTGIQTQLHCGGMNMPRLFGRC